jgi:hypothetical protein
VSQFAQFILGGRCDAINAALARYAAPALADGDLRLWLGLGLGLGLVKPQPQPNPNLNPNPNPNPNPGQVRRARVGGRRPAVLRRAHAAAARHGHAGGGGGGGGGAAPLGHETRAGAAAPAGVCDPTPPHPTPHTPCQWSHGSQLLYARTTVRSERKLDHCLTLWHPINTTFGYCSCLVRRIITPPFIV